MKYHSLLAILVLMSINTASANSLPKTKEARFTADAIIRQLFEMLRRLVVSGDSMKGVPALDPMFFKYTEFEFPGRILRYNSNFSNVSISGLGAFKLNQCEFDKKDVFVKIDMNFPSLVIDAEHYELTGDIWEAVPLKGSGHFQVELLNIKFIGKLYLKQSEDGRSILLDRLENANFNVEQVSSQIDFDGVIDDIFNAVIHDVFSRYITGANGLILQTYSDSFVRALNSNLRLYETWRIMAVIL